MGRQSKVLLFDVMGTLVHDPFFVEIPQFFGLSLDELFEQKHPNSWLEFEHGRIDEEAYLSQMFADGRAFDHEAFRAHLAASYRWLPGMEDLLSSLSKQYAIHALSNYPTWYQYIEKTLGLSRYLEWSFVSCMMGVRKPDPTIYQRAASALSVNPENCVLIDDRDGNCRAAQAVGMSSILFSSCSQCVEALSELGIAR